MVAVDQDDQVLDLHSVDLHQESCSSRWDQAFCEMEYLSTTKMASSFERSETADEESKM